jgi:outer membrane protein assembly complex protein YaeT
MIWGTLAVSAVDVDDLVGKTIKDIEVSGNRRVPLESILFRLSAKEGQPLDLDTVTMDLRSLWETGLYTNLGVQAQETGDGQVVLTYIVRDLPIVVEVDFRGNQKLGKSTITDKMDEEFLTIEKDTPLDIRKVNQVRTLIKKLLNDRGLQYGRVDYVLEPLPAGTARVVFNIYEGSKVRIYDVAFDGNTVYTDKKLRRTMKKVKKHWMFSWLTQHDVFNEEKFQEDVEKVKSLYWEKGYKDVYIGTPSQDIEDLTTDRQKAKNLERLKKNRAIKEDLRMTLTIPVFEGQPYMMGQLAIEGNTIFPDRLYENLFPIPPGEAYDLGKVNEWITELEELHNNAGYLNYRILQNTTLRDNQVVDVSFDIKEGAQIYINKISFAGNTTTRDKVLRREVLLREGDVFRLKNFRNSLLKINQLGFFDVSRSNPDIKFLPNEDKVNITIKGQESGINELNFGLGYNEYAGENGFFSFSTLNFLGKGETLKVQASLGRIANTYDITFTEPWLFDKPRGLTFRIFNTKANYPGFSQEQSGLQVGFSFRPTNWTRYSVSYRFQEISIPTIPSVTFESYSDRLTSSITQSLNYDITDHPFFPTRGRKAFLSLEFAGWQTGGDSLFYSATTGATQYIQSFGKTFMGFNLKFGYMDTFDGQRPVLYEMFRLGGENSVRGYRRDYLGPVIEVDGFEFPTRGDKSFQANFEYVLPVSEQFRLVAFYDIGQVYGVDETWFETDLAQSTGLEMRFSLPVFQAPLRIMYAYKLVDLPGNPKGGEPKFAIGTTF